MLQKKLDELLANIIRQKNQFQNNIKDFSNTNIEISGPVQNERQKLEMIAKSLGINFTNKTDVELRESISSKIGQPNPDSDKKAL